jgi:hypothetical protein
LADTSIQVGQKTHVPTMTVLIITAVGSALSVIPLGSIVAFVGVQSIGTTGLLASYVLSIASRLYSRWSNDLTSDYRNISNPSTPDGPNTTRPASPFHLSKMLGSTLNAVALASLGAFLTTASFPESWNPQIRSSNMNWGSVSLGGVMIVAVVGYVFCRNRYLDGRSVPARRSVVPEKAPVIDVMIPGGKFSNSGSLLTL